MWSRTGYAPQKGWASYVEVFQVFTDDDIIVVRAVKREDNKAGALRVELDRHRGVTGPLSIAVPCSFSCKRKAPKRKVPGAISWKVRAGRVT